MFEIGYWNSMKNKFLSVVCFMLLLSGLFVMVPTKLAYAAPLTTSETLNLSYDGIEKIRIGIESISQRQRLNRRLIIVGLIILIISTVLILRRLRRVERYIRSNPFAKETIDYVEERNIDRSRSDPVVVRGEESEGELQLDDHEEFDKRAEGCEQSEFTEETYLEEPKKKIFGVGLKTIILSQMLIAIAAGIGVMLTLVYF